MSTLQQPSRPILTIRGSSFVAPICLIGVLALPFVFVWAAAQPFFSFSSFITPFAVPLIALVQMSIMTRARFYADHCQVQRQSVPYANIVSVERGRFVLTIRYHRLEDGYDAKLRRIKLPWIEMREDDRQKCLEILRTKLPAEAVVNL